MQTDQSPGQPRRPACGALPAICALVTGGVLLAAADAAQAQGVGPTRNDRSPITIEADKGVEWRQKEQVYVARGNATAVRGASKIRADVLTAHYRKAEKKDGAKDAGKAPGKDGGDKKKAGDGGKPGGADASGSPASQIWKITAVGGVVITTENDRITGDRAVYLVKNGVFTLTGSKGVVIKSKDRTISGSRIEYHAQALKAYVLGNAKVIEKDRKVYAKRFIAFLKKDEKGNSKLNRVKAEGDVVIITKNEIARGDRGDYDAEKRIATLTGNVKLTRGDNQLNGARAEVNFATGISRLLSGGRKRVQVILVPREGEGQQGLPGLPGSQPEKDNGKKTKKNQR